MRNGNRSVCGTLLSLCLPMSLAQAAPDSRAPELERDTLPRATRFEDFGEVTEVVPIIRRERVIEPVTTCRLEEAAGHPRIVHPIRVENGTLRIEPPHRVLRSLLHGRHRPSTERYADLEPREVCETTERSRYSDHITGYRVRYRYGGERFTKITEEHPGKRIPIQVQIEPRI